MLVADQINSEDRVQGSASQPKAKQPRTVYVVIKSDSFANSGAGRSEQMWLQQRADISSSGTPVSAVSHLALEEASEPFLTGKHEEFFCSRTGAPESSQLGGHDSRSGIVPGFLSGIYDVSRQSDRKAIDVTFKYVNSLLLDGKFDVCDEILLRLDLRRLSPSLMIAFLTITAPAKDKLPNRPLFYSRVRQALQAKKREHATSRLLVGLK